MGYDNILQDTFSEVKSCIDEKNFERALDLSDMGMVYILKHKDNGVKEDDKIEGVTLELWRERFFGILERNNLLRE